jgi:DNA-binding response OmpR family regulator
MDLAFHIVVIDDDPALQEFYRLLLENEGYTVTVFPYLTQNISSISALHPGLIILDLFIDGKQGGWPVLQSLKSAPQTAAVPVLLATALPVVLFDAELQAFIQSQNIPVIAKPFDVDAFLSVIRSFLPDTPRALSSALGYQSEKESV